MGRQILPMTVDRLSMIVDPCAACTFWELTPVQSARFSSQAVEAKRGWLTAALLEWGTPGRIALVDGAPAGYVTYAPAHLVPRAIAFPTAPVSEDAIVLLTARIATRYAGQGLGRVLIQTAAKDALRRGITAIEAFGTTRSRPGGEVASAPASDPESADRAAGDGNRLSRTASDPPRQRASRGTDSKPDRLDPGHAGPPRIPGVADVDGRPSHRASLLSPKETAREANWITEPPPDSRHRVGSGAGLHADGARGLRRVHAESGGPDSGQPDSGQPDSGQPDSGQPDSGQPDSDRLQQSDRSEQGSSTVKGAKTPAGVGGFDGPPPSREHCLLPVDFLTAVGFYTVREHPAYPRMRLDLRTALRWREELESAVERLFSPVRSLGRRRPVGSLNRAGISSPRR